jgi:hypothetical protein
MIARWHFSDHNEYIHTADHLSFINFIKILSYQQMQHTQIKCKPGLLHKEALRETRQLFCETAYRDQLQMYRVVASQLEQN